MGPGDAVSCESIEAVSGMNRDCCIQETRQITWQGVQGHKKCDNCSKLLKNRHDIKNYIRKYQVVVHPFDILSIIKPPIQRTKRLCLGPSTLSSFSKCFRALRILMSVAAEGMDGSDMITITYVLDVKTSINAAKLEFLTSILWKDAASLLQLSLNCLIMLLIFSNLCASLCSLH